MADFQAMLRFLREIEVKQRPAQLVLGWVTMTDQGLSHMHGFSEKVLGRVTVTDDPMTFVKWG